MRTSIPYLTCPDRHKDHPAKCTLGARPCGTLHYLTLFLPKKGAISHAHRSGAGARFSAMPNSDCSRGRPAAPSLAPLRADVPPVADGALCVELASPAPCAWLGSAFGILVRTGNMRMGMGGQNAATGLPDIA